VFQTRPEEPAQDSEFSLAYHRFHIPKGFQTIICDGFLISERTRSLRKCLRLASHAAQSFIAEHLDQSGEIGARELTRPSRPAWIRL
jgi:hypothetical protein